MNSAVSPQQPQANLMIAIDTVDATALTRIIRALRVITEARKGNSTPQKQNYRGARARGNFREIASNRPQKRSAFGNCTKIGGLWPDKYLSRLPNRPRNCRSRGRTITGNSFAVSPFFSLQNSSCGGGRMRGQRVKIKEIAEAMLGNTVWCCNRWFARLTTPCAEVAGCTFKDCQVRLATPRELYKCRVFQITTVSSSWKTAVPVYPKADR